MEKAIAFDVDGTLSNSRQPISTQIANMLVNLPSHLNIIITTGGSIELIKQQILDPYEYSTYRLNNSFINLTNRNMDLFPTTGCEYYTYQFPRKELKVIYRNPLSIWDKVRIYSIIEKIVQDFHIVPFTSNDDMIEDRCSQINFSLTGRSAPIMNKQQFDPDLSIRKRIVSSLCNTIPENLEVYIGGNTSIDFLIKGYTKGLALKRLMNNRGWQYDDVLFFGDKLMPGGNDASITEVCKTVSVSSPEDLLSKIKKIYKDI